ncbi:hypothetical protein ACQU0X_27075 [Pseudovibrio ascidiaceicola]|uniref:hypothetical protein n=1 Tax=Pseudovibrio ascidiaceicola TaxID=285279 RepID=UPI003D3616D9
MSTDKQNRAEELTGTIFENTFQMVGTVMDIDPKTDANMPELVTQIASVLTDHAKETLEFEEKLVEGRNVLNKKIADRKEAEAWKKASDHLSGLLNSLK